MLSIGGGVWCVTSSVAAFPRKLRRRPGQGGMTVSDLYGDAILDQRCSLSLELREVPLIAGKRDVPYVPGTLECSKGSRV